MRGCSVSVAAGRGGNEDGAVILDAIGGRARGFAPMWYSDECVGEEEQLGSPGRVTMGSLCKPFHMFVWVKHSGN